jgi:hypothetical protein
LSVGMWRCSQGQGPVAAVVALGALAPVWVQKAAVRNRVGRTRLEGAKGREAVPPGAGGVAAAGVAVALCGLWGDTR